jgi:hypothetical protein
MLESDRHAFAPEDFKDIGLNNAVMRVEPRQQGLLRTLAGLLGAPMNAPAANRVVSSAERTLIAYRDVLPHSSEFLNGVISDIQSLNRVMQSLTQCPKHEEIGHSWRMMKRHQTWKLFVALAYTQAPPELEQALGAELAHCFLLLEIKKFKGSFARDMEVFVRRDLPLGIRDLPVSIKRNVNNIRRRVDRIFVSGTIQPNWRPQDSLGNTLYWHYFYKHKFARDQAHQGVCDHRCLTVPQIIRAADHLRAGVMNRDPERTRLMLSSIGGLPPNLMDHVPLLTGAIDDWNAVVDLAKGVYKLDLEVVTPDSARPLDNNTARLASKILVRPMPKILQEALQLLEKKSPGALSAGDLTPAITQTSRTAIDIDDTRRHGIITTPARFLNSLGPFALLCGLTRVEAALATGDFRLIPKSKFYYLLADREATWNATKKLYSSLDWGDPVPYEGGIAFGSLVVPTVAKVAIWFDWIRHQVTISNPGRRCGLQKLILYHNTFAKGVASLLVLIFVLRERSPYTLYADELRPERRFFQLLDKAAGEMVLSSPMPLCAVARAQLRYWLAHCAAVRRRLELLGQGGSGFAQHIDQILQGSQVHLLVMAGHDLAPEAIGCQHLTSWWPQEAALVGNFGRHFFQTELTAAGVLSRDVDDYLRHHLAGCGTGSSVSDRILRSWADRIIPHIDKILASVPVVALPGLARRSE